MAGDDSRGAGRRRRVSRERVVRTLTFWLRPEFVLRVVNRFQKVAGFDRSIALASGALTALIPLTIVASALSSQLGGRATADRIIDRYELTGGGAEAVSDVFSPASGTDTSLGIIGFLFLLVAVLSFSRAVQRLIEQTWELDPLSVRNTLNGLLWIGGLGLYVALSGALQAALGHSRLELTATLLTTPLTAAFLIWSGWVLSAKRIARHDLLPFGILGSAMLARLLGRRGGLRPAPLRHLRHPLRRDRRRLRHDLRALLRHGRARRLRRRRPRTPRRTRPHPPRPTTRRRRNPTPMEPTHHRSTITLANPTDTNPTTPAQTQPRLSRGQPSQVAAAPPRLVAGSGFRGLSRPRRARRRRPLAGRCSRARSGRRRPLRTKPARGRSGRPRRDSSRSRSRPRSGRGPSRACGRRASRRTFMARGFISSTRAEPLPSQSWRT